MDPPFVFTLVHGTFSPDAPWTRPGSRIRRFLETRYPGCVITAPVWSGLNTHADRLKASDDIGAILLAQHLRHPAAKQVVIAHSHGGTVTLHACENPQVRESLSGVITLGTPFIHTRRRDLRVPVRLLKELVKLGRNLLLVWLWGWAFLSFSVILFIYTLFEEGMKIPPHVGTAFAVAGLVGLLGLMGILLRWRLRKSPLHAAMAGPLRRVRNTQRRLHASMREPYERLRDLRLLAISVDRDEARLVLRFLRVAGGFAHVVHDVLSCALWPAVVTTFVVGVAVLLSRLHQFYAKTPDLFDFLLRSGFGIAKFQLWGFFWIALMSLVLHGLMVVWPFLSLRVWGYGERSIGLNWLLDIHVRKSPGFGPKWSFLQVRSKSTLRPHSFFYNGPYVLRAMARWIDTPARFPAVEGPARPPAGRSRASPLVRLLAALLVAALALWLWCDPIQIYHIHS